MSNLSVLPLEGLTLVVCSFGRLDLGGLSFEMSDLTGLHFGRSALVVYPSRLAFLT